MLPKWHILYGYVFAILLFHFFNLNLFAGIVIFLSSFVMDIDHFALYVFKKKELSLLRAYTFFWKKGNLIGQLDVKEKNRYKQDHFFLHGVEFLVILIFLSLINKIFFWIALGVTLHLILDLVDILKNHDHLSLKISQIWLWQRNKNKKEFDLI